MVQLNFEMMQIGLGMEVQNRSILEARIEIEWRTSCIAGLWLGEHQGGFEAIKCHFLKHVNEEKIENENG